MTRDRIFFRIQLALPFVLFLCLASDSLAVFFTGDDVMNLHQYMQKSWTWWPRNLLMFWSSAGYRPLGGVVYLFLYKVFGFHPLPFRVFLVAVLIVNLALCYRVARTLSGSRQIALWTILFCCYHAAFNGLWLNFGTIYDVLGYTCFFCALLVYAAWVRTPQRSTGGIVAVLLLYVAGLELKEIVVTLPAVLLLWNLLFTPALRTERLRWFRQSGLPIVCCGVLALIYVAGKMTGPESLSSNPAYASHWTMQQFATTTAHYIRQVFYLPLNLPTPGWGVAIVALMIVAAAVLRSRLMVFSVLAIVVTQLPVSFILPRGGFAIYITFTFWGVYAAALFERMTRLMNSPRNAFDLWVVAAVALIAVHVKMKPLHDPLFKVQSAAYEALSKNLDAWHMRVRPGSRVLLVDDPFPAWWITWDPMFLINMHSYTTEAVVNRQKLAPFRPPDTELNGYDYVIDYDSAWLLLKRPGQPLVMSPHLRDLDSKPNLWLCGGFKAPIQGLWRETAPVFTMQTRAPDAAPHQLSLSLVSYLPAALSVQIDDGAAVDLGVQPVPNIEIKLPVPSRVHTVAFRGRSANEKVPVHIFLVNAQLK